jgi:GNAT superfamily N-acetyltransferase
MIVVRNAETDADLEAWIHVHRVVLPNDSAGTIELHRAREKPERRLVLAELDGELAGSGYVDQSDLVDRFCLAARVLPAVRRRGVGSALLRELGAHAAVFGAGKVSTEVADEGSRAFAERFGFQESNRELGQVKVLGDEPPSPPLPDGLRIATIAERPELLERAYPLALQGYADMATEALATISLDDWLRDEATQPEGSFVALAGDEIVGYSGLVRHDHDPRVVEDGLTVVRRDWRRRGLAAALKRRELAWAAANGFREVVTWTQQGNEAMRRLNARLGYEDRTVWIVMVAPLPLQKGV